MSSGKATNYRYHESQHTDDEWLNKRDHVDLKAEHDKSNPNHL